MKSIVVAVTLAAATLLAVLAAPAFFGAVYLTDDLSAFHLPLRAYYAKCLANGDDYRWCPQVHCGFDLHGEGQVGMWHPWHLLLYSKLPTALAFDLELLSCIPLCLAGTYLWLRRWLTADAAAVGALLATFGGVVMLRAVHLNALAIVAHIPWQLWAVDRILRPRPHEHFGIGPAAFALALGSQLLLGYPQYVWFAGVAVGCYALTIGSPTVRKLRGISWIGLATIVGLLVGAGQLLPTAQVLALSERAETSREFRGARSLPPANLLQAAAPYATATRVFTDDATNPALTLEYGCYFGALAFLLALHGCWPPTAEMRPLARFGMLLAVVGIALALGRYTPLFELTARLPLVSSFRAPCRATVLVQLGIVALAAVGWKRISARGAERRLLAVPVALSAVVASVDWRWLPHVEPADVLWRWYAPGLFAALAFALWRFGRGARWAGVAAVALGAADLGCYGVSFLRAMPPGRPKLDIPETLPEARYWMAEHGLGPILRGHRLANGYVGLPPARRLDYSKPESLAAAGVRFRIAGNPPRHLPIGEPLPRVTVVSRVLLAPATGVVDLAGVDLQTTAVADRRVTVEDGAGARGGGAVVRESPGDIAILATAPEHGLLVLSESWHPEWTVTVDDEPTEILRANGDFLGVAVPRGRHDVRFRWRPRRAEIGLRLAWLGGVLVVALALYRSNETQ